MSVNGSTEISITPADVSGVSSFSDGSFGFYNYSQAQVLYSAIRSTDCSQTPDAPECRTGTVPEPATLALIAVGLLGMGAAGRKAVSR
ncbi:MAG TPA: PEP-CTERM sorting domain-containing protein [Thiohalobacter sp.]|nr:PEP-CTERM sorting domain-containing protein [Thiohalobacter sp.]